jgi:hypothetical protein
MKIYDPGEPEVNILACGQAGAGDNEPHEIALPPSASCVWDARRPADRVQALAHEKVWQVPGLVRAVSRIPARGRLARFRGVGGSAGENGAVPVLVPVQRHPLSSPVTIRRTAPSPIPASVAPDHPPSHSVTMPVTHFNPRVAGSTPAGVPENFSLQPPGAEVYREADPAGARRPSERRV